MNTTSYITFDESGQAALYVALKNHLGKGVPQVGSYQISLNELTENYNGPEIYLDFNSENKLYGIEILGDVSGD